MEVFQQEKNLNWKLGPKGYDSDFKYQNLGWPWARNPQGDDLFLGVRKSAIGDGSCFYHSIWWSIGILRRIESSPLFSNPSFAKTIDYIDIDYRDPEQVRNYVSARDPSVNTLNEQRSFMVDRLRNDIYTWLISTSYNMETKLPYSEEEARILIMNDISFMKIWFKDYTLNPNLVKFYSTKNQAVLFLRNIIPKPEEYIINYMKSVASDYEKTKLLPEQKNTIADLWEASKFDPDSIINFTRDLRERMKRNTPNFLKNYDLRDEIVTMLISSNKGIFNWYQNLKSLDIDSIQANLRFMLENSGEQHPIWLIHYINKEVSHIRESGVDEKTADVIEATFRENFKKAGYQLLDLPLVKESIVKTSQLLADPNVTIKDFISEIMVWADIEPLIQKNITIPEFQEYIDSLLTKYSLLNIKILLEKYIPNPLLNLIKRYIDVRYSLVKTITDRCGFNLNLYVYPPYSNSYIDNMVTSSEKGWELLSRSIDPRTNAIYTVEDVNLIKEMDPRTMTVGGYPISSKWVEVRPGQHKREKKIDDETMELPLNSNYFTFLSSWSLKGETYERTLRSLKETLPVVIQNGFLRRKDAGEDTFQYISGILGVNIIVVVCYNEFVHIYNTWENSENKRYVVASNQGYHFEPFGISDPNRNTGFRTLFEKEDPFILAYNEYGKFFREFGGSAEREFQYLKNYPRLGKRANAFPVNIGTIRKPSLPNLPLPFISRLTPNTGLTLPPSESKAEYPPLPKIEFKGELPPLPSLPFPAPAPEIPGIRNVPPLLPNIEPFPLPAPGSLSISPGELEGYRLFSQTLGMDENSPSTLELYRGQYEN